MNLGTERRIGGSDAAKLLGVSKYGNAADVYARVVLGVTTKANARMARGIAYEPVVRARYAEETGAECMVWVKKHKDDVVVFEHDRFPWATCSPDDVTTELRLVEYKTVSVWSAKEWVDGPPIDYTLQCLWSTWVGDLRDCHLYAAFGSDRGDEFEIEHCRLYRLERDAELEADFAEAGAAFWRNHVVPRRPPSMAPMKGKRAFKAATHTAEEATP